jgi:probable F420-dependent oxidoreductase
LPRFKVGVQLHPQQTTVTEYRRAWQAAERLGVATIWTWDHFFPLYGDRDGPHLEGWSLLAAMAVDTSTARFGALVTCNAYRNPDLLADMARTVNELSGGRLILGIGSGWFQRDFDEYGYEFGTAASRLAALGEGLPRIRARLARLNPPATDLPILIGGGGEKVTLRLVAEHADLWNTFGPAASYDRKNRILDQWCERVGRDPKAIERTVSVDAGGLDQVEDLLAAGAEHVIVEVGTPFDLRPVERLLAAAGRP